MFLLESPHRGDSNEYTQYTIINIKKKITLNYPKSAAMGFFSLGTQERVLNSRGKRAISVRDTEVLLTGEHLSVHQYLIDQPYRCHHHIHKNRSQFDYIVLLILLGNEVARTCKT